MKAKLVKLEDGKYDLLVEYNLEELKNTKLSLKNCQAIERGYDLDELLDEYSKANHGLITFDVYGIGFKAGFQKALELMSDKKFSAGQLLNAMDLVWQWIHGEDYGCKTLTEVQDKHIQSLQQTEWDVTFNPDELDADGCLILKLKSE